MLSPELKFHGVDPEHWKRLTILGRHALTAPRVILSHTQGVAEQLVHTKTGPLALTVTTVTDPQAVADELLKAHPDAWQAWVLDPNSVRLGMSEAARAFDPARDLDEHVALEYESRMAQPGMAIAPQGEPLWLGLPVDRLNRFLKKMAPENCVFVLAVFEGDALWAALFCQIVKGKVIEISGTEILDPNDVKDVVGRDQHPFLLAAVANAVKRPAFGWFVERPEFEAWMQGRNEEEKDFVFQTALMKNRATFDFNILVDKGITPLSPVNPGSQAFAGVDREDNPRTKTPDPNEPGPSAF